MIALIPLVPSASNITVDPLLPMPDGRKLLEHVISALPHVDLVCTIAHPDLALTHGLFGPRAWYPLNIKRKPIGILDTLMEARALINNDSELLINYGNCFLPDEQAMEFISEMRAKDRWAGVVCFPSQAPIFQREPSGKFAMAGIFYFKQGKTFVRLVNGYRQDKNLDVGHIAFAVTGWLGLNKAAAFVTDNVVYLKTPQMVEAYLQLQRAKTLEAIPIIETSSPNSTAGLSQGVGS